MPHPRGHQRHLLEIIGEAAKHLSHRALALAPEIPWRRIAGTRDRLAYAYFSVDLTLVWEVLARDLPPLRTAAERILASLSS
ncbi:MAG: HepT-like ribonuclease domain-containing protein [Terriglobales bacterium]